MDCSVCSHAPNQIMNTNNYTICESCYEGATTLTAMMNNISPTNSPKGFASALKWVQDLKETGEELKDKVEYLAGFVNAFRDPIYSDIQVKPATGPFIPSHRALLASRSTVFENMMLDLECAGKLEVVEIQELNYEELQAFLEFLYAGNLPKEMMEKYVYSLSKAAQKYEVFFLQKFCEVYSRC